MKVAIISDQHFGCRKNSTLFHDYFLKFYNNIFFPTLKEHGITTVVDMGDTFDSRKGIDFSALFWAKSNYYDKLQENGITVHTIVGNHTAYYKNTNKVNAIDLLLREYKNVKVYSEVTEIKLDKLGVLIVPWINQENEKNTCNILTKTSCKCVLGHLELKGFNANKFVVVNHGYDGELFKKFSCVFSGHYHTRSSKENIRYLGNPYEMYWSDYDDVRGFHLFDTDTLEVLPINNPYRMFHKVYYEDTEHKTFDAAQYENKIIKLIIKKNSDNKKLDKFVEKLYSVNVAELKIVENTDFEGYYESTEHKDFESEDTISILNRYIQDAEIDLDKSFIRNVIQEVYQEACEMV